MDAAKHTGKPPVDGCEVYFSIKGRSDPIKIPIGEEFTWEVDALMTVTDFFKLFTCAYSSSCSVAHGEFIGRILQRQRGMQH